MGANIMVREGMTVLSADGEKLGKVAGRGEGFITIEKGLFFKKDFVAREADVSKIVGDDVWLSASREEIERRGALGPEAMPDAPRAPLAAPSPTGGATQETRMPLAEEQLEVQKTAREVGEVRVRKEVHTEQRQVTVPVTHEEVRVERVPASGEAARPGQATFTESEVRVPITEEEVEIRKRPVVREEVRVSKTPVEEERTATASVRHEEAVIESEGDAERRTGLPQEDPLTRK